MDRMNRRIRKLLRHKVNVKLELMINNYLLISKRPPIHITIPKICRADMLSLKNITPIKSNTHAKPIFATKKPTLTFHPTR